MGAKFLIVYATRTGTTRKVAEALAAALHGDIEAIEEPRGRGGPLGYLRSLIEARRGLAAPIEPGKRDPAAYDLVVLGTPVWGWSLSSPMRAYLLAAKRQLPAVAFFCTLGGSGAERAFAQMSEAAGAKPRATCAITVREVSLGTFALRVAEFARKIQEAADALAEARASAKVL